MEFLRVHYWYLCLAFFRVPRMNASLIVHTHIKPEEVEIVHRVGAVRRRADASGNQKPRAIIAKFVLNKTKMKLLTKRRNLKGKKLAITEDMAPDIAKRLKKLKEKPSVEITWFVNGKIRYKLQGDTRVKELRDWGDFLNMNVE